MIKYIEMDNINLIYNHSFSCPDLLEFNLSGSKSISQRVLIINYLNNNHSKIINLSNSEDGLVLINALNSDERVINLKQSGTALRFLITLFSYEKRNVVLEGDSSLLKRPISRLINALNLLGANIETNNHKIIIHESHLIGGKIDLNKINTSQFISSLLLVSPYIKNGIHLIFDQNICSKPYIQMTTSIMKSCGAKLQINNNQIKVFQSEYTNSLNIIESDWTSASYLILAFSFSKLDKIKVKFLNQNSLQGDSVIIEFFALLGIFFKFDNEGVLLEKKESYSKPKKIEWNFNDHPDLFPTILIACFGFGIELLANGVSKLIHKESNRILSMKNELSKFNGVLEINNKDSVYLPYNVRKLHNQIISINSHKDHRIALSFAPLSLLGFELKIDNKNVINKSYPNFFNDLTKFGILIK